MCNIIGLRISSTDISTHAIKPGDLFVHVRYLVCQCARLDQRYNILRGFAATPTRLASKTWIGYQQGMWVAIGRTTHLLLPITTNSRGNKKPFSVSSFISIALPLAKSTNCKNTVYLIPLPYLPTTVRTRVGMKIRRHVPPKANLLCFRL